MLLHLLVPNPKRRQANPTAQESPGPSCSKSHGPGGTLAATADAATVPSQCGIVTQPSRKRLHLVSLLVLRDLA